ncbi:MAG: recombinase family protein [Acholeplasmatales bacterium]|jgi:DNA invertase Pin-like site-specific DNA recombinase|nr:recombinase family protein [Acholeplasmatales bacterium]
MNKTAIYARISRSDDSLHHTSIEHQIKGITNYCNMHGFTIIKIYKDLNISGSTMDRPAFTEMMKDLDNGIIDTIIVKDLSRFGRNYLEVGKYLDEIFLINDVRFIAIDDNYDNKGLMDEFAAFKNIFNEMYLKDIRKKIKTTFDYKSKTKLLNSRPGAFYGLTIDEQGKYIIDEEASNIVRRIFSLYIEGFSTKAIANQLTKECIISPGYYRYIKYNDQSSLTDHKYKWKDCTIYKIITNEGYTGKIINRKYLYMKGKRLLNPNPIVIEHGLPRIIDEMTFNKAQDKRLNRPKKKDKVYINPYSNIVHCGCCNKVMRYTYSNSMNQYFYVCSRCKTRIYINDLRHILKEDIQTQLSKINDSDFISYNEKSIQKIKKEMKQIDVAFQKSFEDYAKGKIAEDKLKLTIAELTNKKNELKLNLNKSEHHTKTAMPQIANCQIEDGLILKLITNVTVINTGKRKYEVHVNYNFKD